MRRELREKFIQEELVVMDILVKRIALKSNVRIGDKVGRNGVLIARRFMVPDVLKALWERTMNTLRG